MIFQFLRGARKLGLINTHDRAGAHPAELYRQRTHSNDPFGHNGLYSEKTRFSRTCSSCSGFRF